MSPSSLDVLIEVLWCTQRKLGKRLEAVDLGRDRAPLAANAMR